MPLSDWVEQSAHSVGVVFSDVVDSTLLLHREGTVNYAQILLAHRIRATQLVARFEGRLINQTGDGIFAAFRGATNAYEFARALFVDPGHVELGVRVGIHVGTVQTHGSDLVGRTVHFGARVMAQARGRELWLSDTARKALESEDPTSASSIAWQATVRRRLKGIPRLQRLWRVNPVARVDHRDHTLPKDTVQEG